MFALVDPAPIVLQMHASFLPALLYGGLAAAFIALMLSFPVFRVRGDYLAIVTLGFGFIIRIFAMNNPAYTNGAMGLNDIPSNAPPTPSKKALVTKAVVLIAKVLTPMAIAASSSSRTAFIARPKRE